MEVDNPIDNIFLAFRLNYYGTIFEEENGNKTLKKAKSALAEWIKKRERFLFAGNVEANKGFNQALSTLIRELE